MRFMTLTKPYLMMNLNMAKVWQVGTKEQIMKTLAGMTIWAIAGVLFVAGSLKACDREYEIDRERIEQYKMEMKQ